MDNLIDRQAAIDALHMHLMYRMGTDSNKKRLDEWINNLPPAQPERKTGRWIPCSERLPKEEDYRECMECLDGAVWYYTSRKTMGLGYYYYSTKQWSTICDMKPDGKVIAWMPLPSPYREDGGE